MPGPDYEQEFLEVLRGVGAQKVAAAVPKLPDPTEVIEDVPAPDVHGEHSAAHKSSPAVTAQNLFRHPDAHPLALDLVLLRHYGVEWLAWEPESLEVILPEDLRTSVSDVNLAKINACKTMHLVDTFWQRWEVFSWCTMALNGVVPDFYVMQVPTFAQCLVAVDIANRIREDVPFSEEVKTYLCSVLNHDGMLLPQEPLPFVCPIPVEDVDLKAVEARWGEVRPLGKPPTGDTLEDEQLRRMLVVNGFLEESRTRLRHQLELVPNA